MKFTRGAEIYLLLQKVFPKVYIEGRIHLDEFIIYGGNNDNYMLKLKVDNNNIITCSFSFCLLKSLNKDLVELIVNDRVATVEEVTWFISLAKTKMKESCLGQAARQL